MGLGGSDERSFWLLSYPGCSAAGYRCSATLSGVGPINDSTLRDQKSVNLYTADNALRLTRHDRSICQLHGGPGVTALLQPIEYYSSEWYKDNGDLMKAVDNALACFRQDHENHDNTLKRLIKRRQNRG